MRPNEKRPISGDVVKYSDNTETVSFVARTNVEAFIRQQMKERETKSTVTSCSRLGIQIGTGARTVPIVAHTTSANVSTRPSLGIKTETFIIQFRAAQRTSTTNSPRHQHLA